MGREREREGREGGRGVGREREREGSGDVSCYQYLGSFALTGT